MKNFSQNKKLTFHYDYRLISIVLSLLSIGFILLASASMGISSKWYNNPLHFILHQTLYLMASIFIIFLIRIVPLKLWEKISGYLLICSIITLVMVLIPKIGHEVNGSFRWIKFGHFSLQVSEFSKLSLIIYISSYLSRKQNEIRTSIIGFIKPLILLSIIAYLLILEPDFGAIVVLIITTLGMMYLAGVQLWQFVFLLLLVATALIILAIISPYRVIRLTSFLNPWDNPFDSGYQLVQSLIAFGRGGILGVGLGNGIQKLFYLPEVHTDFLFAVLAEEFGIVGQIVVLGLFILLASRIFYLGKLASNMGNFFASYLSYGFGLIFEVQMIINVGVNTGLLPTKGLPLPFMSYGGSSMLFNCIIIAILLRVYHELSLHNNKIYFIRSK